MKFLIILTLWVSSRIWANEEENINAGVNVYEIKSFTLSSGGGVVESGDYKLTSSIGQLDASNELVSGNYILQGGFLHKIRTTDVIFKDGFD